MKVPEKDAHDVAEYEVSEEDGYQCEWHTEEREQEVRGCQVHQKHIGHGSHPLVLKQGGQHQAVPQQGQREDHRVQWYTHFTTKVRQQGQTLVGPVRHGVTV